MNTIKYMIRNLFNINKNESFEDGILRKYYHIKKKLSCRKITLTDFRRYLFEIGIEQGDTLIVHSAWRAMYMLDATPEETVDTLIDSIGDSGTLLMPCYGESDVFDVNKTVSKAGVLTEVLRNKDGCIRSIFPKFSMIAYGKNANNIVKDHINSNYQFDKLSPYYKSMEIYNAKILLIGLGKRPHKISVFHCASYDCRDKIEFYERCYSFNKESKIITNQKEFIKSYIDRDPRYQNNKRIFRKLFDRVEKKRLYKLGLNMILFDSKKGYNIAKDFCNKGGKIYRVR